MQKSNIAAVILLGLLGLGFAYGVAQLFYLRFVLGDVYPAYSSLRADPLGTKAFYDGLAQLPGLTVQRHYRPLQELQAGVETTLFYLDAPDRFFEAMPPEEVDALQTFAERGGRLVMTLGLESEVSTSPEQHNTTASEEDVDLTTLSEQWGFAVAASQGSEDVQALRQRETNGLPPALSWHTSLFFASLDAAWQVIYAHDEQPVLIERPWGQGAIVLASDTYLLSNEAMQRERYTMLLTWLVGTAHTIIFDETHFGIQVQPGMMALIGHYRLHGVLIGLLILAALMVWKNASPLVPPAPDLLAADATHLSTVAGHDASTGLVTLLQRHLSPQDALRLCVAEWHKSCAQGRPDSEEKFAHMQHVLTDHDGHKRSASQAVEVYRRLSQVAHERRS